MPTVKTPDERKVSVNCTLLPQHVTFLDEQIEAGRFANRSVAIDFAIYLFARSEIEGNSPRDEALDRLLDRIGQLQEENARLNQNLRDAAGDCEEEWLRANRLGGKALEFANKIKKLEARIEALEAEAAD